MAKKKVKAAGIGVRVAKKAARPAKAAPGKSPARVARGFSERAAMAATKFLGLRMAPLANSSSSKRLAIKRAVARYYGIK